jgi:isoquinoline 1-oxidoreductase beta subunit
MTTSLNVTRRGFVIGGAAAGFALGFRIPFGTGLAHACAQYPMKSTPGW